MRVGDADEGGRMGWLLLNSVGLLVKSQMSFVVGELKGEPKKNGTMRAAFS